MKDLKSRHDRITELLEKIFNEDFFVCVSIGEVCQFIEEFMIEAEERGFEKGKEAGKSEAPQLLEEK